MGRMAGKHPCSRAADADISGQRRNRTGSAVPAEYFEKKRLSLKALSPRDLETFFRYERQQEEASVQQLLDWHRELTDALQYAVANN